MAVLKVRDPVTGEWKYVPYIQPEADQSYNPESENAQSGQAVAEALVSKQDKFAEVDDTGNVIFGEEQSTYSLQGAYGGAVTFNNGSGKLEITGLDNPVNDEDAVNKRYVDGLVGDIETALDSIVAIQETLIGGAE